MKLFGGPKQPRRIFKLNKFGADRHHRAYDERKRQSKFGGVMRYAHMPEILPRIRALGQKFGHFAFMLALIYRSARLLPENHPMLNPVNIGRYGVRDVIGTAANNLVIRRDNLDQIVIFGAVIAAMVMVFIQIIMIAMYSFVGDASASTGMFTTASPNGDLLFTFLRQVFGVSDIFGTTAASPQPGLHAILAFYSTAMMIIAVLIVLYYIVVVVGEAAQTGKPFGGRFNSLWAPIRLVLALGLLVPLGGGLNAAQYGVLHIAKWGSSLATNGWKTYADNFISSENSIAISSAPSVEGLAKSIFGAEACRAAYNKVHMGTDRPVTVLAEFVGQGGRGGTTPRTIAPSFNGDDITAAQNAGSTSIRYMWTVGQPGEVLRTNSTCGTIIINLSSTKDRSTDTINALADQIGHELQRQYITTMGNLIRGYTGADPGQPAADSSVAMQFAKKYTSTNGQQDVEDSVIVNGVISVMNSAQTAINSAIRAIPVTPSAAGGGGSTDPIVKMKLDAGLRGWGTAGIYYIEISRVNQMVSSAISRSYPNPVQNPKGDEASASQEAVTWWNPWTWGNGNDGSAAANEIMLALANLETIYETASPSTPATNYQGNPTMSAQDISSSIGINQPLLLLANMIFGDAIIRLVDAPTLDPMTNLIQIGNGILEKSAWTFMVYIAAAAAGSPLGLVVLGAIAPWLAVLGYIFSLFAPLFWFVVMLGLVAGIILAYILPLLPFMYFFFAVVNWVIEVAEAFISMPLFALAHLRIDGDGLPGQVAMKGYETLFGVMMRPLLIILGLIISCLIFGAATYFLNSIYKYAIFAYRADLASSGNMDFTKIDPLGFGLIIYILVYVYMIYVLANSTFKLIDKVPDEMMRWIGGGRGFTGDKPVDIGNMQSMAIASYAAVNQGQNAISQTGQNMRNSTSVMNGNPLGNLVNKAQKKPGTGGGGTPPTPTP